MPVPPVPASVPGDGPAAVRSIAVTAEDVVAAVETNRTTDRTAVLRITPPFSGRMRARLHVGTRDEGPIHVDPDRLLVPDAPAYPRPAETEDRLRADPDAEYTVERHRERHASAVADWREDLASSIRETVELPVGGGREVEVYVLGSLSRSENTR